MSILDNVLSGVSPVVAKPQAVSVPTAAPTAVGFPSIPPAPCPRCQSAFFFLAPGGRHFCLSCNRPRSPAMIRRLFTLAGWPESPEWVEVEGGRDSAGGSGEQDAGGRETPATPAGRREAAGTADRTAADRRPTALSAEFPDHPPPDWPADRTYDDWWTESAAAALQRYDGTAKMAADIEMYVSARTPAAKPAEAEVYVRKGGKVVKASAGAGGKKRPPGGGRSLVA